MMPPNLHFGIENLPERTSECFPGNESAPRGTLRGSSGAPRGLTNDYSKEGVAIRGAPPSAASTVWASQRPGPTPGDFDFYY